MVIGFWNGVTSSLIGGVVSGSFAIIAVVITLKHQDKKTYPERIVQLNILITSLIFLSTFLNSYLTGSRQREDSSFIPFPLKELIPEKFHDWLSTAVLVDIETYELITDLLNESSNFKHLKTLYDVYDQRQYDPETEDSPFETEAVILNEISKATLEGIRKRRKFYDEKLKKASRL